MRHKPKPLNLMRYIKFDQAKAEIYVPGVGAIPFYLEGNTAVICVELNKEEIKELVVNNGRLYILGPTAPGGDRPLFFKPQVKNPFIKPQENGNNQNGTPGKS